MKDMVVTAVKFDNGMDYPLATIPVTDIMKRKRTFSSSVKWNATAYILGPASRAKYAGLKGEPGLRFPSLYALIKAVGDE